jgi:hypothetical protein
MWCATLSPVEPPRTDATRSEGKRVIVVMPAYNAAKTLERTYADVPHGLVDHVILVDDVSQDETVDVARQLGLDVRIHRQNLGYGGNQKTCYDAALAAGAVVVVMLHPDYQYDATRIPDLIAPILDGDADLMLGSRFLGDPLAGGMPRWKYVSNRFLTTVENVAFGLRLSEYHTGLRAYSRRLLERIPYHLNSDDFVFDQELVAQVVAAGMRRRIGEIAQEEARGQEQDAPGAAEEQRRPARQRGQHADAEVGVVRPPAVDRETPLDAAQEGQDHGTIGEQRPAREQAHRTVGQRRRGAGGERDDAGEAEHGGGRRYLGENPGGGEHRVLLERDALVYAGARPPVREGDYILCKQPG